MSGRRHVGRRDLRRDVIATTEIGRSLGTDYFGLRDELTEAERDYLKRTRTFVDTEVLPVINDYWERAEFPWELIKKMGALGIVGDGIVGYGCPPMSPVAAGLIHMELNRGDGSLGTFQAVQAGLAMRSIWMLGSEEQKQRWLPGMARLDLLGAFALTEAAHGSDAVALETTATPRRRRLPPRRGEALDRQRHDRRRDRGVGPRHLRRSGQGLPRREGRTRLRRHASSRARARSGPCWQADITLTGVHVPAGNVLPGARTFKDAVRVLASTRIAVAWGALGHAVAAYEAALSYAKQRTQFGKPLVSFQMVQDQLVKMLAEVTAMQLYCLRVSRLEEQGKLTDTIAALAKMNNTLKARQVIADARDLLGGNGILLDYHVIRHMADIEAIYTYEGTEHIQTLMVGRDITGVGAFS